MVVGLYHIRCRRLVVRRGCMQILYCSLVGSKQRFLRTSYPSSGTLGDILSASLSFCCYAGMDRTYVGLPYGQYQVVLEAPFLSTVGCDAELRSKSFLLRREIDGEEGIKLPSASASHPHLHPSRRSRLPLTTTSVIPRKCLGSLIGRTLRAWNGKLRSHTHFESQQQP